MSDQDRAEIDDDAADVARAVAEVLGGRRMACAESFTAGLLAQTLAAVPSSSEWFQGSLVAYRTEQKRALLGVDAPSALTERCAAQMAVGAARLFSCDIALATTGVAGPDPQEGLEPGTVMVGWVIGDDHGSRTLHLPGDPAEVVQRGVRAALRSLLQAL